MNERDDRPHQHEEERPVDLAIDLVGLDSPGDKQQCASDDRHLSDRLAGEKQDHHRDCHENRLDDQRPIVMRRNRRIRPAQLIATRRRFLPMSATCLRRRV
jgi:hypothetical protein